MGEDAPIVREAFPRTVRLVSSARLRPPVLAALVATDEIDALAEIEGATSARLIAEDRGTEGLDRQELVYGVPYAAFVNASFAYSKPREPNRFNASRGAWYAALAVLTCMREVAWHMTDFLAKSGELKGVVDYAEMFASMAGEFVDLRGRPGDRASIPIRRSAIRPATRSPIWRGRGGSTASSIRRCGTKGEPASSPCGRTRCSRSRRAPSTGSNGRGGREPAITRISE